MMMMMTDIVVIIIIIIIIITTISKYNITGLWLAQLKYAEQDNKTTLHRRTAPFRLIQN